MFSYVAGIIKSQLDDSEKLLLLKVNTAFKTDEKSNGSNENLGD